MKEVNNHCRLFDYFLQRATCTLAAPCAHRSRLQSPKSHFPPCFVVRLAPSLPILLVSLEYDKSRNKAVGRVTALSRGD